MTSTERHHLAELARLRRILANAESTPFEKEVAQASLDRLEAASRPAPCPHCLDPIETHGGAVCKVVARFRKRHGRGSLPTTGQAAEVRAALAEDAAKAARERDAADLAERQRRLF